MSQEGIKAWGFVFGLLLLAIYGMYKFIARLFHKEKFCRRCGHSEKQHWEYDKEIKNSGVCWHGGQDGCMCTGFLP
jgi:hypothetical protein